MGRRPTRRRGSLLALALWLAAGVAGALPGKYAWEWRTARQGWPPGVNLRRAAVGAQERRGIAAATMRALRRESWGVGATADELRASVSATRIRLVDLDGDGVDEVIELGWTGQSSGDGNSAFRILKKVGGGYRVLCSGAAERVNVDVRTPMKPLVVAYAHDSADAGELEVWRVKDGAAARVARYGVTWRGGAFAGAPKLVLER